MLKIFLCVVVENSTVILKIIAIDGRLVSVCIRAHTHIPESTAASARAQIRPLNVVIAELVTNIGGTAAISAAAN